MNHYLSPLLNAQPLNQTIQLVESPIELNGEGVAAARRRKKNTSTGMISMIGDRDSVNLDIEPLKISKSSNSSSNMSSSKVTSSYNIKNNP